MNKSCIRKHIQLAYDKQYAPSVAGDWESVVVIKP